MIHDQDLLDRLDGYIAETFDGVVYRTTRLGLDPLAPSVSGGRWSLRDDAPTLYTSLDRDGSIAEMAFHLSQLDPIPRKPLAVSKLAISTRRTLRLARPDLINLGADWRNFSDVNPERTRAIGAAAAFLELDGLRVPSARSECENLVLFALNHSFEDRLEVLETVEIDWIAWARQQGFAIK